MRIKHSYKNISRIMLNPVNAKIYLNRKVTLYHMIEKLPETPWADIEILDWLPEDNLLPVEYYFYNTSFGRVLAANTPKGVCYLGLVANKPEYVLSDFEKRFNYVIRVKKKTSRQKQVIDFLNGKRDEHIVLHLRGTPYQTEIWRKLLRIPYGRVISYVTLGGSVQYAQAAGMANGRNPIFWIVPCQRVVKVTGGFERYFWGDDVKKRLLAWEFVNTKI